MPHPARIRVKICGITRPGDAVAAANAGADAIGLVFYPASPRAVDLERAGAILAALPPFVTSVGLFVNADADEVRRTLARLPLDLLQFHGDEDAAYCASFDRPFVKALRVRPDSDILAGAAAFPAARGLLLDAWHEEVYGGSGRSFDWTRLRQLDLGGRLVLAGGLRPDNVKQAIRTAGPWAVDVSSGVESAPGEKSEELINAFMQEVHSV